LQAKFEGHKTKKMSGGAKRRHASFWFLICPDKGGYSYSLSILLIC
jgi:hypothetical protein